MYGNSISLLHQDFNEFYKDMSYNREEREMHDAKCGDCGKECKVPFEPRQDRPVYCNECFQNHKPQNRGGGGRFGGRSNYGERSSYGGRSGGSRYGGGQRREREMHDATCGDCGKECQIPFKPKDDRPVYCKECFVNHKPQNR